MFGRPGRGKRSREPRVPRSREERLRRIKKAENRMLGLAGAMCVAIGGAGWVYKRNNAIPNLVVPQTLRPARNGYDFLARAARQLPPRPSNTNSALIAQTAYAAPILEPGGSGASPQLFSLEYEARYPLGRQLKYLRQNASALSLTRRALALPFVQPPQQADDIPALPYADVRRLARLLVVQAHARARRDDWAGASGGIESVMRLGTAFPRGGALVSWQFAQDIRRVARAELRQIAPRLRSEQSRALALRLEALHQTRVPMAQVLEEDKRATQRYLLRLMRGGDLRDLYVGQQEERDQMPRLQRVRLAWMSKPAMLSEHARCMDWQIAQASLPYPARSKQWPFPEPQYSDLSGDWISYIIYPRLRRAPLAALASDALDRLAFTSLALRAFRLDHKYLPRRLQELVPRYLKSVPRDPFDPSRALGYRAQPVRASWIERRLKLVQPPAPVLVTPQGLATPTPFPGTSGPSLSAAPLRAQGPPALAPRPIPVIPRSPGDPIFCPIAPPPQGDFQEIVHPLGAPWTLWSIGPDGRDDSGLFFREKGSGNFGSGQFRVQIADDEARFDIVGGINR